MNGLMSLAFLIALLASGYFLVRFIIAKVRKQPTDSFKKKLIASVIATVVTLVGFNVTRSPEQIAAHNEKVEAERKATEEKKLADEKAAEEKRLAEQKTAEQKAQEEARKQAEREAVEERRRQEQAAQIVAEQDAFQNWESKINAGISAVDDHWENLWQYTLNSASNGAMDAQTVFQNLRELEHKLIDDEMIFQNATVPQEMSQSHATKMNAIRQGFASWAKLRRKGCENFRLAFGTGNITPQVMQESVNTINQADAFMLKSTADLVDLENEINSH